MDATAVKAEIKKWEHDFRAQNGRSATIEDVKTLPRIAEKYKLYKKLTKEAEKKGKAKEIQAHPSWTRSPSEGTSNNPFLTPVKAKRTEPPDPFVPVKDIPSPSARKNAAIVKARKRLRGESVSPSPLPRDKRHRAHADSPAHAQHSRTRSASPPGCNVGEGDSFVDDSPVKAPAGGKAFTPLFEEALPLSQPAHSKVGNFKTQGRAFSRAKTMPNKLFSPSLTAVSTSAATEVSRKRTLSQVVTNDKHESYDERPASNRWNLLPPSPPPQQDDTGRYNATGKGKGKTRDIAHKKAKKAKLSAADDNNDEDDTTSSDGLEVKIVAWRSGPRSPQSQERNSTLTIDPELRQFHVPTGVLDTSGGSVSSRFEVNLPEEMRRVLALSHHDIEREREEEDLVKGLMRGRRRVGGEVWAPGEIGGESEASDGGVVCVPDEEDWEGEGVPWEIAEL